MNSVAAIALAPHVRSEKDEERLCDDLIARIASRANVVRFSQPRNTMQTLGIPDRRYRVAGVAFFWEVKSATGRLRAEQVEFLTAELAYGCPVGVGTLDDLLDYVNRVRGTAFELRREEACAQGLLLIAKYRQPAKRARRGKL